MGERRYWGGIAGDHLVLQFHCNIQLNHDYAQYCLNISDAAEILAIALSEKIFSCPFLIVAVK
jgi:hypothetical protein